MIKVLFVCLGNICRSPMAEAVFRDMLKKEGLLHNFEVDSAGIGGWHEGERPHIGTRRILDEKGISYEGLYARKIKREDFERFDYIIGMDEENLHSLNRMKGDSKAHIGLMLDFVDGIQDKNVPDPYYTGNFDYVYQLIKEGCQSFLDKMKKEHLDAGDGNEWRPENS